MRQRRLEWQEMLNLHRVSAAEPTARAPADAARPLGADTVTVLSELGIRC
jgi:hypothetical protein